MTLVAVPKDAPIFKPAFEYQESTLQLPFGDFSIFSDLKANRVDPLEAMVTLTLCYRSKWSTGQTWRTSSYQLSDLLHISQRYIRDALAKATDWIQRKTAPKGHTAGTFQITHHRCDPLLVPMDEKNRPLSFAVPRGEGGPFERLFASDIDWKATLVWLMLKLHSDWRTGITNKISMQTLAKWTGFGKKTVCDAVKTLHSAGMLERLSEIWECSQFQLYPKPYKNRAARRRAERQEAKRQHREMRTDGEWRYSFNEKYRLNTNTEEIQTRAVKNRGQWQPIKDRERHQIPKAIRTDFDRSLEATRAILGGFHNAQSGSQGAGSGSHHAHPPFERDAEATPPLRL